MRSPKRRVCVLSGLAAVGLIAFVPAAARAVTPAIVGVDHQDRHVVMTLSAPRAQTVTVYFATSPERGTDGRFLDENVEKTDYLTAAEIQSGNWLDSEQIEPGSYFVMLKASRDYMSCVSYDANVDEVVDQSCADGFSLIVPLEVEPPTTRYRVKATVYGNIDTALLTLVANPLGKRLPYQVCWKQPTGKRRMLKKKCVSGSLPGYSWNSDASDLLDINTRSMTRRTKFTWYSKVGDREVLASKTISVR